MLGLYLYGETKGVGVSGGSVNLLWWSVWHWEDILLPAECPFLSGTLERACCSVVPPCDLELPQNFSTKGPSCCQPAVNGSLIDSGWLLW